jgi:hypothetical protein
MKKIGIVLAIIVGLTFIVGCPTTDTGNAAPAAASAGAAKAYSVDVNSLSYKIFNQSAKTLTDPGTGKKNTKALAKRWDGVLFTFSGIPDTVKSFNRVTINAKYYNEKGDEIAQGDGKVMVVLVYDPAGDLEGPEMGPGKNTPIKEFNVGGFSGLVSTDKGVRVNLTQVPGAILLQAADASVKFIELTQVTFHSGSASGN